MDSKLLIEAVMETLPHRYPFLLVDRVVSFKKNKELVALKNVSVNEPFFQGHFPEKKIVPGVILIEAMAQACGVLIYKSQDDQGKRDSVFYLVGVDSARFKHPAVPGDQVFIKVVMERRIRDIYKFTARATVDDNEVATASIMTTGRDK